MSSRRGGPGPSCRGSLTQRLVYRHAMAVVPATTLPHGLRRAYRERASQGEGSPAKA